MKILWSLVVMVAVSASGQNYLERVGLGNSRPEPEPAPLPAKPATTVYQWKRPNTAAEEPLLHDGTTWLPSRLDLTNRVVTFTNLSGRLYEKVRLESVGLDGLKWSPTEGLGGGRLALADLSPGTREQLGIPEGYVTIRERQEKAKDVAKVNAIFEKRDRDEAARAAAAKKEVFEKFDKAIDGYQKHGVFGTMRWSGGVVKVDVGAPFFLLDHEDKKLAVLAVITRAALEDPTVKAARLLDRYSGKEIGRMDSGGFSLK